jgi:hypothetical protein
MIRAPSPFGKGVITIVAEVLAIAAKKGRRGEGLAAVLERTPGLDGDKVLGDMISLYLSSYIYTLAPSANKCTSSFYWSKSKFKIFDLF